MNGQLNSLRVVLGGAGRGDATAARHVVAVAAGKGGAGTSTVAALLALAAHTSGRAALLVDAQPLGSLHLMLGVESGPGLEALRAGLTPDRLIVELGAGLDFLAAGSAALPSTAAERRALFRRLTGLFDAYDTVIVDAGARVEGIVAASDAGAGTLLSVVGTDAVALAAAHAVFKTAAARAATPRLAAIINPGNDAAADAAFTVLEHGVRRFLGRDLLHAGSLPDDPEFRAACAAGQPLAAAALRSPLLQAAAATLRIVATDHTSDTRVPLTALGQ